MNAHRWVPSDQCRVVGYLELIGDVLVEHAKTCSAYVDVLREVTISEIGIKRYIAQVWRSNEWGHFDQCKPDQPCIRLWGQSSCLSACVIYFPKARIFMKLGWGITEGGFLRNPAASL